MKPLQINEIVKAVEAIDYTSDQRLMTVESVSFDSRESKPNSLFVPLQGQTDGHQYIDKAIANGATAAFWSLPMAQAPKDIAIIQVEDTLVAMQKLAQYYLEVIQPKVIGITGSAGKTTTKDMTAAVLSANFNVHKTEGNYNNEIGLPYTILAMPENTEILVLEMGMSGPGEIRFLSQLAKPDIAIITMIGESHIEYLGSRENIAKAKLEICDGLAPDGTLIYPGNEPLLTQFMPKDLSARQLTVGLSEEQNVYAVDMDLDQQHVRFTTNLSPTFEMDIPVTGAYNVQNALYALATAYTLGLSIEQVHDKLAHFQLTANRMEWLPGYNESQLLNDAYNANPSAMRAVVDNLAQLPIEDHAKRVLVLGDMLELGPNSPQWHASIAEVISSDAYQTIFLYGKEMKALYEALLAKGFDTTNVQHFVDDREALIKAVKSVLAPDDLVLIKASNGTGLLEVVEALKVQASSEE
ncbi:UDP-N-acetylmuramoyl-tripeptide--D-alanyl-D-alanine ligase [Aerococcus suis]|uniref:UDP-N-acetylmuramoyl-tripeptide--D-alanyl-D-alanine ligase n=1 Tax=Aerococcus suis TaxID=371602 RepID=A0A1W1YSV6_9LACT|nr:UDP-N-acetylmuramoyl-tripeptide--D-alanyl-D-alanine ligase [Aerococcus suis]MDD7758220.1 UDP-N-acetylmuramoyl-tripeptide--D-alanyl-D-alanine ligase [Aerococcus suis]MDY4646695.1 UDP-N-acetylmuramoyl-tripeptide--D-alanyl-D-alanine ligase [Aerococcus suis]SMC38798.1 UDP-N-acetylmuramoyl-tripeptide--D-alanyl-D-alanine ligase [Aerococcus suis]